MRFRSFQPSLFSGFKAFAGTGNFRFRFPSPERPLHVPIEHESCGVPGPTVSFLPEPVEIKSSSNGLLLCQAILIFEPSMLNFEVQYKVICAFASNDFDDATEFEIYSWKQGSWQVSGEICFANLKIDPKSDVYANGVVYWGGTRLLAYDLAMDRSQMHYQYYNYSGRSAVVMGTIHGELCTSALNGPMLIVNRLGNVHSNTMQMESRSSMWNNLINVKMDSLMGETKSSNWSVFAVSGTVALLGNDEKLFSDDFEKKEQRALVSGYSCHSSLLLPYVNSLASLEF